MENRPGSYYPAFTVLSQQYVISQAALARSERPSRSCLASMCARPGPLWRPSKGADTYRTTVATTKTRRARGPQKDPAVAERLAALQNAWEYFNERLFKASCRCTPWPGGSGNGG